MQAHMQSAFPVSPLRRLAWIIYGALLLLGVAMPQQIADRLDDFEPNAAAHAGKLVFEGLAQVTDTVGIGPAFTRARQAFLEAAGERH